MFKTMSNDEIKKMIKTMRGVDFTDEQIDLMKESSTKEKIRMAIEKEKEKVIKLTKEKEEEANRETNKSVLIH